MFRYTDGSSRGSTPSTVIAPSEGRSNPHTMRSSVVLPAPLGPSRPVRPGPNEHERSETATFCPNHFETSVTSMVAPAEKAGPEVTPPASA